jgi:hypothetical protein
MKPAYNRLTRRQFLVGGGVALALPVLPSLLPREVRAQAQAAVSSERYFVHMTTWHGVFQRQFFGPLLDLAPAQKGFAGGIEVRGMPLASRVQGSRVVVSDIIQAASSALTPRMLSRMNVINGLDFHTGVGHNRGYSLGGDDANPSIDQVLARSRGFYPVRPAHGAIVRNLVSLSSTGSGTTQTEQTAETNVKLFDRLFGTTTTPGEPPVVLVDRVKEHADLVMADPACSADCRNRLSNYLDLLSDVQSQVVGVANGGGFPRPTVDTGALEAAEGFYGKPQQHVSCEQLWNDIVVAAFAAGISRVYVCGPTTYTFGPDPEHAWHNNYAHALDDPERQAGFSAAVQLQFEGAMLDIARKLDQVVTADGATLFDKALVASGFELGSGGNPGHHHNRCIPVVSLGDAGGYLKTGQYLDYRDLNSFSWSSDPHWYSGLLYNQWMGMVLRAMGVSRSDQETMVNGYPNVRGPNGDHTDQIWNVAGQDLPWLRA